VAYVDVVPFGVTRETGTSSAERRLANEFQTASLSGKAGHGGLEWREYWDWMGEEIVNCEKQEK
jgi:hypothetical protein